MMSGFVMDTASVPCGELTESYALFAESILGRAWDVQPRCREKVWQRSHNGIDQCWVFGGELKPARYELAIFTGDYLQNLPEAEINELYRLDENVRAHALASGKLELYVTSVSREQRSINLVLTKPGRLLSESSDHGFAVDNAVRWYKSIMFLKGGCTRLGKVFKVEIHECRLHVRTQV